MHVSTPEILLERGLSIHYSFQNRFDDAEYYLGSSKKQNEDVGFQV